LHSSCIVCFTPLVAELRITQNYHIACSRATYLTYPEKRRNISIRTLSNYRNP
jgi:hypothetical protein